MALTTRNNGDTIRASWFNDVKTEVESIDTSISTIESDIDDLEAGTTAVPATSSDTFAIGDGTPDNNKSIVAQNGDATEPELRYNETDNKWQFSNDGATFSDLGSGAGGINYIADNPDAESGIDGWTMSDDTNFVLTQNTTTPLRGDADFKIVKAASDQEGDYIAFDFDLQKADLAKKLLIQIDVDTSDSNYVDGDIAIKLYDLDNSAYIEASTVELLGGVGTFYSSPQTDASSTNYELRFVVNNSNTNGYTIYFDNVNVGPQVISYGVPATDWEDFTSTLSNITGTQSFKYSRVGDSIHIEGSIDLTAAVAGEISFTIPDGLSLDSSKLQNGVLANDAYQIVGETLARDSAPTGYWNGVVIRNNTSLNSFLLVSNGGGSVGNSTAWNATIPFTWASGDHISISMSIPVLGWSSNAAMSSDFGNRDVTVLATSTSTTSVSTAAKITFDNETKDTTDSFTTSSIAIPATGTYEFNGALKYGAAGGLLTTYAYLYKVGTGNVLATQLGVPSGAGFGIPFTFKYDCVKGEVYEIWGQNSTATSLASGSHLSITKLASPQTIFPSETVVSDYYGSTTTVTSTPADVVFINKNTDTHGITSDNTNFIISETSYYDVSFGLNTTSFAVTAIAAFWGQIKAGSVVICEGVDIQQVTSTRNFWATGFKTGVYLEKGTIVKLTQSVSNGTGALADTTNNFLSIKKSK